MRLNSTAAIAPAAVMAAAIALVECTTPRQDLGKGKTPAPEVAASQGFDLTVHNRHYLDVNLFIQHDGQTSRLTTVTGSSAVTVPVPAWMIGKGGLVRLVAEPIGENSQYVTDDLILQPGETVTLNVENAIARSNYSVR